MILSRRQRTAVCWYLLGLLSVGLSNGGVAGPQEPPPPAARAVPVDGVPQAHVFLPHEPVELQVPETAAESVAWRMVDERGRQVLEGRVPTPTPDRLALGNLPVGWYRVAWHDAAGTEQAWTTAAVITALRSPTPPGSPICVDAAIAWFARDDGERQSGFSRLAALAGADVTRDRLRWADIEPSPQQFPSDTTYDRAAESQRRHGLQVLQVFHDTPRWATDDGPNTGRFPPDLRHVYRLARVLSQRFRGRVQAWEPWNEANIPTFGGHTMDELCSYQKAAYLGFKAGDPDVTVCWNVTTAVPTERQTQAVLRNETWSYFDTYNIHTYDWADEYLRLWEPARQAACGKPLWVTESDRGLPYEEGSSTKDLSPLHQRLKAEYVTQSYVQSLHAGADRHFHFILGEYSEGPTQFGLLRHDLTPTPGYAALAALGRILAGGRCLGRYTTSEDAELHVYAFRARPDGLERDVLVAWVEGNVDWPLRGRASRSWQLPEGLTAAAGWDHLGRELRLQDALTLTSAPIFLLLSEPLGDRLPLQRPARAAARESAVCPVVVQCVLPREAAVQLQRIPWACEIEYAMPAGQARPMALYVYNFAAHPVEGHLRLASAPEDCHVQPSAWQLQLEPLQRLHLPVQVTLAADRTSEAEDNWFEFRGQFGASGSSVLALRLNAVPQSPAERPAEP